MTYARPRDHTGAVIEEKDWDDLSIWVRAFSQRGWEERSAASGDSDFNLGSSGPKPGRLVRMTAKQRLVLHDKRSFFGALLDSPGGSPSCVPPTFLEASDCAAAIAQDTPGTIYFFKRAQASRGSGVTPFTELDADLIKEAEESPGVFQREVPGMKLWPNGAKFDIRVLAFFGPGRRCWACRTVFVRVAGNPYDAANLSKSTQCTNLSVREDSSKQDVAAVPGKEMGAQIVEEVTTNILSAISKTARIIAPHLPLEGHYQYFGFDIMLDNDNNPWILEVNSTPHLARCNRGPCDGLVDEALRHLLCEVVEPLLQGTTSPMESSHAQWPLVFNPEDNDG